MEKWVLAVIILVILVFVLILGVLFTQGYLTLPQTDVVITGSTP